MDGAVRNISVVIPTYNRLGTLSRVIDHLLASETEMFEDVEIIVVDDGSEVPAIEVTEKRRVLPPFRLFYIRQENSGPAVARNRGFAEASHEIVLFIDDDILVSRDLLTVHARSHEEKPFSVIFGRSPLHPETGETQAKQYFDGLQAASEARRGLIQQSDLASGNISFEKRMFPDGLVYHGHMTIPGAEEFELSARLARQGIPVFQNNEACGWHLQSARIRDKCVQEYKYGISVAEAYKKLPELMNNPRFKGFVTVNGPISLRNDGAKASSKKILKRVFSSRIALNSLVGFTEWVEKVRPDSRMLPLLYRYLCGLNVFAGVRSGLRRFSERPTSSTERLQPASFDE